ncbi:putative protein TPRXL [Rhodotorula toruloides ATCC 204091]|nr:putative protein TPRXL [Rhodotorula toruloides ATCC 204091]
MWKDIVYTFAIGWWYKQGSGPLGEPPKRALINAMDRLVDEFGYGRLGLKDLLPSIVHDRNSYVTQIVLQDSTLANYLLEEISEWSEKLRDAAASAVDHQWVAAQRADYAIPGEDNYHEAWAWQTWNADQKVALLRQLLHYLYDVLTTAMVKPAEHKQRTYRSRDMGRHGESSERRRSRSPEHSEHSLAHSLLNQPLSARKARIYGMV